jgi:aldose sugar dehydrogenase
MNQILSPGFKTMLLISAIGLSAWKIVSIPDTLPSPGAGKEASENYKNYCAGCHGNNLEEFVDRKWVYGSNANQIGQIITKGVESEGMPGFEAALSVDEIKALTEYILAESKKQSIQKAASQYSENSIYGTDVKYKIENVVSGLEIPWGLEFLPNGDLLISERNGTLSRFTADKKLIKIEGLPEIRVSGQGGLMDIKLHPDYAKNGFIYIAYSYYGDAEKQTGNTAIIRARLKKNTLTDITPIYKGTPAVSTSHHYGCKMEFDRDNHLYFSIGDRGYHYVYPQALDNSNGKIHRVNDDGSIPDDNPFVNIPNAERSVFSYGHRNPQGLAMNPVTGEIWESEHGPRGGDEINLIKKGKNYGWPVISFGINYDGTILTPDTAKTGMEQPVTYYIPSIAPCGMSFLTSTRYKGWENDLLIGSLRFEYLEKCTIENDRIVKQERLLEGIGRVRNVKVSPDGYIYVSVENPGRILKLIPVNE